MKEIGDIICNYIKWIKNIKQWLQMNEIKNKNDYKHKKALTWEGIIIWSTQGRVY